MMTQSRQRPNRPSALERLRALKRSTDPKNPQTDTNRLAIDVANFLIGLGDYTKTPLQIQKMAYVAHGHMLAIHGRPLFKDQVEAWKDGPVMPDLYDELKEWSYLPIPETTGPIAVPFDSDEREVTELVFMEYGKYCGYYLSQLSHDDGHLETPWAQCYQEGRNATIPNHTTKEYFEKYLE